PERTVLLSPFDSLIWDRARARTLFGYEVAFEAYVVPEKRRYGYYSLAILHQGKLVGRLDPKMDRETGALIVRAVFLEPGVRVDAPLAHGIAGALRDLARFLGARTITVERSEPAKLAERLQRKLQTGAQSSSARRQVVEQRAEA
ncbi:MAG TPA: crosslink repair DNA glycosylase YcaQ family protein, partial [Ktedonobacterales bacterium]|nr:crosslink repair DNA glycosylase YcaQ family protein [Ktedonobacterales bacterium]